jgi:hypothetical protein
MEVSLPYDLRAKQLYPVSVVWQPPFTMLVDLVGHGDAQVRARDAPCRVKGLGSRCHPGHAAGSASAGGAACCDGVPDYVEGVARGGGMGGPELSRD